MLHQGESRFVFLACLSIAIFIAASARAQTTRPAGPNLVANAGFEDGAASWTIHNNNVVASATADDAVSRSGKRSLRLTNVTPNTPNMYLRAYQSIVTQPFTTYRISCWVKGDSCSFCSMGGGPGWTLSKPIPDGTFDWQQISIEWSTGDSAQDFELMLFTQGPTKSCWIDDVEFVAIRTDEARQAELQKKVQQTLDKQKEHLKKVLAMAEQLGEVNDAYVQLGVAVARRFIDRIESLGLAQNMSWTTLQIEEVETVLNQTEDRLSHQPKKLPGTLAWADGGPVDIRDGVFYSGKEGQSQPGQSQSGPIYFGGYGAFNAIFRDLPNFRALGVNLIQDGRTGPSSLNADGSPGEGAKQPAAGLAAAAKAGVKVDELLSPHFFPEWGYTQAPDLRNGNIGFLEYNIDHPKGREIVERWLRTVVPAVKDQPALFSYCLSNEPAYVQSGKDPYSRPKFVKYLKDVHGEIGALNTLYGTTYKSFEDVALPKRLDPPTELNERRAFYDWCRFNQINFADWHHWMSDIVKSIDPKARTHAKVFANHALDQSLVSYGVDPELFCEFSDIAGCDNFASYSDSALTSWPSYDFFYDLMNAFRNQPVFNSELHFIPDALPAQHIPFENSRAVMWQGALHHLGAATGWVWEGPGPGLQGAVYLRPANIYGVGRAMLDANRLADEVTEINQAKPRVALLYSQPSIFWEKDYQGAAMVLHSQLKFAGEKVTFVTERQIAAGKIPEVAVIISPRATHVADKTVEGLIAFVAKGGKVLVCGDDDLQFDPYHRPRTLPAALALHHVALNTAADKTHPDLAAALRDAGLKLNELVNAMSGAATAGVEYRVVDYNGAKLIPLINMTGQAQTVRLPESLKGTASDLLTGQPVKRDGVVLEPMVPVLLRVESSN